MLLLLLLVLMMLLLLLFMRFLSMVVALCTCLSGSVEAYALHVISVGHSMLDTEVAESLSVAARTRKGRARSSTRLARSPRALIQ